VRHPLGRLERLATAAARVRGDLPLAVLDAVLVVAALGSVLTLRYGGAVPATAWARFETVAPVALGVTIAVNWLWGLYGQIWRHASVYEARRIALAGGTVMAALTTVVAVGPRLLPLSVVVLGGGLYTMLAGAMRFQSRLFALHRRHEDERQGLRVAVLGAGESGAMLVRDMLRTPKAELAPVAMLDDDPHKQGRSCMGVRVVGPLADLPRVVAEHGVHQVVLAIAGPAGSLIRRVAALADEAGVPLRVLPDVGEIVNGQVTVHDLRDLRIEDLLGREQIQTDLDAVRGLLHGRRVLITGAGGSIGSEVARQVAACEPAEVFVLDHDETHLHDLCSELVAAPAQVTQVTQVLADIRERDVVQRVFRKCRPDVVFHAAAHKHVPLLEAHPVEAVRTNVVGSANVVAAAAATGVDRLVFISTDKAVRPSSVMGASKRLGEDIVLGCRPEGARYCAVRFGNVLGSRGSVTPTFIRQISSGGPVTITDARMTRFFMSIPEAVQLVLQAATMADGGEVFILEMGEPVRIIDLAERMIRLAGRRVGADVEIRVTGMRPGEKLVEELHTEDEQLLPTAHPSIGQLLPATPDRHAVDHVTVRLTALSDQGADDEVRRVLFGHVRHVGQVSQAAPPGSPAVPLPASRRELESLVPSRTGNGVGHVNLGAAPTAAQPAPGPRTPWVIDVTTERRERSERERSERERWSPSST
jgi:FlaA1/EpsC-like NDP-sugar epimerase